MFKIDARYSSGTRRRLRSRWFRHTLTGALALVTTAVALAGSAAAQRYKSIDPKMNLKAARALGLDVANAMRNAGAFAGAGQKTIDSYFKTFYFPMMTQTSPADLQRLGKLREDLFKRHLRGATVPAAQAYLTNTTLGVMRVIARDNYHPAVRYNAALILGMLDQQYAAGGANPTPPVPLPAGTNDLLELLEQGEFNGVKVHPSVKVGALEGLERHVRFGLDAQYSERVTKVALAVLAQEPSVLGVGTDVNDWIKCQAASVLARQFKQGPNAEVHTALTKLIADEKMSLEDRCCIVGLLQKMKYSAAAGADVKSTLVPLGNLTQVVVTEGAEKALEFEDMFAPGGRRPSQSYGRSSGNRRGDEGPKLERRQLLARLTLLRKGAKSLSEGLSDEEKQKVQALTDLLTPVMAISADKKSLDLNVAGDVIKLKGTINNMIASWQPAATPAEAAAADFTE